MPAMVQDVKVNRQLDNIIKLYSKMQNLQGGNLLGKWDYVSMVAGYVFNFKEKKTHLFNATSWHYTMEYQALVLLFLYIHWDLGENRIDRLSIYVCRLLESAERR